AGPIFIGSAGLVAGGATDPNFPPFVNPASQRDAAAIRLLGGTKANAIDNDGVIQTLGQYAILADPYITGSPYPYASTTVTNRGTGTIIGDIDLGDDSGSVVNNLPGGVLDTPTTLNVGGGTVTNAGTFEVGGANAIGMTVLNGNYVQTSTGVLRLDLDPVGHRADLLDVTGTVSLAGSVMVAPMSLLKGSSTVLTAAGGIQPGSSLTGNSTLIYAFTPLIQANSVAIATDANFVGPSDGSAAHQSAAAYLQRLWDSGNPAFASIFEGFLDVGNATNYAQTLTAVSGGELLGVAAARYQASQIFARSAFSCPVFVDDTTFRQQDSCVWARTTYMGDNRSAESDFPGFAWQGTTVKFGGQAEVQPGLFLGGAVGYEIDHFTTDNGLASGNGSAVLAVGAVKRELGPWTLTGAVDAGIGWVDSARKIPITGAVANASSDSFNVGLHARAAYQIPFAHFYLEPALDGDLNDINLPSYTESGAGAFDLRVKAANDVIATGTPNLRVGTRLQLGSTAVDAYVGAGVSFISGNTYTTNAQFADVPAAFGGFTNTLTNASVAGKLIAGLELFTTSHLDLRLEYDGLFARHQTENGGQVRLSYRF
ncbi:MAG TPA: autotransporter domain-containing protein, partial [Caulobacteraceae bacterium]|nr:autotransporter domain-containing protein [Caulobacteraceae bacterium]